MVTKHQPSQHCSLDTSPPKIIPLTPCCHSCTCWQSLGFCYWLPIRALGPNQGARGKRGKFPKSKMIFWDMDSISNPLQTHHFFGPDTGDPTWGPPRQLINHRLSKTSKLAETFNHREGKVSKLAEAFL